MKTDRKFNFAEAMAELEKLNKWFQQEDIDLDEGLEKIKSGKALLKRCQDRLSEIENEFTEITRDIPAADGADDASTGRDVTVAGQTTIIAKDADDDSNDIPF